MNAPQDQLALDLLQPAEPTLDNFVVGDNGECLGALQAMLAGDAPVRTCYLWGLPGTGKSHLARAFAQPGALLGADAAPQAFRFDRGHRRWAVDDVERLDDAAQQALFGLINAVRADAAAVLLVTGAAPPLAQPLREDLRSRLGWGLVYEVRRLSDADKATALTRHAAERGVTIADGVIPYLMTHASRDIRTLIALLDGLDRFALERRRAITLPLLREFLQPRLK